jgi:hypothetical protein
LRSFGYEGEFGVGSPGWEKIVGDLFLESGDDWHNICVGEHGALVDYGDLDGGSLSLRQLRHRVFSWNRFGERAA